jgi:alkyl hydroperoxide reductase subunit AhpF
LSLKHIAVVSGGNSGIEADLKADKVLVEKSLAHDKITIIKNVATKEVIAKDGKVAALTYEDRLSGELKQQPLVGVFVQIGCYLIVINELSSASHRAIAKIIKLLIDNCGAAAETAMHQFIAAGFTQ